LRWNIPAASPSLVLTAETSDRRTNMTRVITRPRRIVVAVAIAALLGGAALLSVWPAPAPAAFHECPSGEFCLYFNEDGNGGFYHFAGSDPNLDNDHYVGGDTGEIVGDTARYAENNGVPATRKDVIVYGLPGYRGARDCIQGGLREGDAGRLPRNWWNNIESFRWVTPAECAKAGIIQLPRG
jgi:Peptidase inhibitor family I36